MLALSQVTAAGTQKSAEVKDIVAQARGLEEPCPGTSSAPVLLTSGDLDSFRQGRHFRAYDKLGAHPGIMNGVAGTFFAVWAPNAQRVQVVGSFNNWNREANPLQAMSDSGIWAGFVPGASPGACYKYYIVSRYQGHAEEKADPFGFRYEVPPCTASIVCDLEYT